MDVCNYGAHYLSGVIGGLLVGWISGQFWQSYIDHKLAVRDNPISPVTVKGELDDMFNEEETRNNLTVEEIRNIGRQMGDEPILLPTSTVGGRYVTNQDLDNLSQKSKEFKKNIISRADELDIIRTFEAIVGMNFFQALGIVEEQGYTLHPVYINNGQKRVSAVYSGTTLGVKVNDPDFTGTALGKRTTITEIVDVGGRDKHNRGMVKI